MPLLAPNPPAAATEAQVAQIVRSRTGGRVRRLCVCIDGDRLVLSGETSSYYDKQLASHAALETCWPFIVQNDLVVE